MNEAWLLGPGKAIFRVIHLPSGTCGDVTVQPRLTCRAEVSLLLLGRRWRGSRSPRLNSALAFKTAASALRFVGCYRFLQNVAWAPAGTRQNGPVPPPETTCPQPQLASPQKEQNKVSVLPAAPGVPRPFTHSLSMCGPRVGCVRRWKFSGKQRGPCRPGLRSWGETQAVCVPSGVRRRKRNRSGQWPLTQAGTCPVRAIRNRLSVETT